MPVWRAGVRKTNIVASLPQKLARRCFQLPGESNLVESWPYRAARPQRYGVNYAKYLARGGMIRLQEDVEGFVVDSGNQGDVARFYFFCLAFDQLVKEGLKGDFAELGVYKGHTATLLATMARRLNSTAYFLDTFEGFDRQDLTGIDVGVREKKLFGDTSLEAVRQKVGEANTCFIKGYFPQTADKIPETATFCLVHIDCDLYAPVRASLEYFYPRVIPGGFLLIHDYSSLAWDGAEKAVDEFFSDKPESVVPMTDGAGTAVIRKARLVTPEANWLLRKQLYLLSDQWIAAADGGVGELLGSGWSKSERWGVWGVGECHGLNLALPLPLGGDIELEADVHAALIGPRTLQSVDVTVAGQKLATWEFTQQMNRAIRSITIPAAGLGTSTDKFVRVDVEFRPHSVASPHELDPSTADLRPLGLGLHRLRRVR
jgi:Macrocin-O-methyltransferase (TylF)